MAALQSELNDAELRRLAGVIPLLRRVAGARAHGVANGQQ
jgi:hypothetical protein